MYQNMYYVSLMKRTFENVFSSENTNMTFEDRMALFTEKCNEIKLDHLGSMLGQIAGCDHLEDVLWLLNNHERFGACSSIDTYVDLNELPRFSDDEIGEQNDWSVIVSHNETHCIVYKRDVEPKVFEIIARIDV